MKIRTFVSILILVLAVLIIAGSCATVSKSYKRDFKKDMVGTWLNQEYYKYEFVTSKAIVNPDQTVELYDKEGDKWPTTAKIIIKDRWTDSEGNIFYKIESIYPIRTEYELWKLNNSRTIWELMFRAMEHYTEIDPNSTNYRIYYRQ